MSETRHAIKTNTYSLDITPGTVQEMVDEEVIRIRAVSRLADLRSSASRAELHHGRIVMMNG